MNGFSILSDSYRKAAERGEITQEQANHDCRLFDFLADCSESDIYTLFDSSAFNEIAKSYMRLTVRELVSEGIIDEEQGQAVKNRFALLFDEKRAKEVIEA